MADQKLLKVFIIGLDSSAVSLYEGCIMSFGGIGFVFYCGFWLVFLSLFLIKLGSSVSILSSRLNLFLVYVFDVEGFVV